jgi:glycosyltransferase involved in cell wall biosynthesis
MIRPPEPLVSIVTPFFNTEDYLSECIESVLKQSYQNWEYILVNNCSTDRSLEVANSYVRKDSRIRIVTNEAFLTQVQNYNRALRLISPQSKYCKIVQADDWIFPECLMEMVGVAETHPSAGIIGAYRLDDVKVNCDGLPYPSTLVSGRDICRLSLLEGLYVFGTVTSILYRSDIIRGREPFFNESSRHEDTEACYEILQQYDFGFVHQILTFTRRENESITTRLRRFDPYYLLDKFIIVLKYGKFYLSESEYEKCFRTAESKYYWFLGKRFWFKDRKKLLEYHREGLTNIGRRLSISKMMKFAFIEFIIFILNPNRVMRYLSK